MSSEITRRINQDTGVALPRIEATIRLLDDGSTIPFIARYRKEATGNLDEVKIRDIADRYAYYKELEARRQVILFSIERQGKLTEELREEIQNCYIKQELEDLYLPYRPKRRSKAGAAREKGLEPLANFIEQQLDSASPEEFARSFVSEEKNVASAEAAIDGALHILAERVAEKADFRKWLRDLMLEEGSVEAKVNKEKEEEKTKYSMYYDFHEPVSKIPSHRMLAIRRGAREKILTYSVRIDHDRAMTELKSRFQIRPDSPSGALFVRAIEDAYRRLIEPAIQNEVRSILRVRAEQEAIRVFEENLRGLLLAPPAGPISVMGIDPGLRTGSKLAVVDATGQFVENQTIYLVEPKKDLEAAEKTIVDLVGRHSVRGIVIGNGTGSRETETFVRSVAEKHGLDVFTVVTSEAGASVYSASKRARQEFPKLDITVRGAISIARRLQDPLAELVKIDPKSIGVGQYQHDVDQKKLKTSLGAAVESSVNSVGVDLNAASADLLKYISGINESVAEALMQYRSTHGAFGSRAQLREIEGFGEKTFEQAAGFLRVKEGAHPLDRTSVHPESYPVVEKMAASLGVAVADLIENPERIEAVDFGAFERAAGRFTVSDIRAELLKPAHDPRRTFTVPHFRDDIREIKDLEEGMELEGTVTNVTNFGAFVDLGVHQDGLVHISELSHRYVADARRAVRVGEVVKVKVIGVDPAMKRISLSMKAIQPKSEAKPRRPERRPKPRVEVRASAAPAGGDTRTRSRRQRAREKTVVLEKAAREAAKPAEPEASMEEKIRRLQEKFKSPDR